MKKLIIERVRDVEMPKRMHDTDSGIDFYAPNGMNQVLAPRGSITFPLGVKVEIEKGYDLVFHNKSGLASKNGIVLGACVVDSGYQGELVLNLINTSGKGFTIKGGERIAQAIVRQVELCDVVEGEIGKKKTSRGEGKTGSTGKE